MLVKGILSFPTLFTPKIATGATEAKYSVAILLPPNDPQIAAIQAEVNTAAANGFPSGMPAGTDCCFQPYDQKYNGKDYYDPRFSGYMVLSCTAKADDKPVVVDGNHVPIIDPGVVYSGCIAHVHMAVSAYTKGRGGIGGWLNGVMFTGEEGPFGRLDGRPSAEQMFATIGQTATPPQAGAPAPVPPTAPTPPPAAPSIVHQMTDKAAGATYESFIAGGWTDEAMIAGGYMLPPGGAPLAFN